MFGRKRELGRGRGKGKEKKKIEKKDKMKIELCEKWGREFEKNGWEWE